MTEKRAKEIALRIVQYEATRKDIRINQFEGKTERDEEARKYGVTHEEFKSFLKQVFLPAALSAYFDENIELSSDDPLDRLSDDEVNDIAFKIVRNSNVDISPRTFGNRLNRLNAVTRIEVSELREFYIRFVIPQAINAISGLTADVVSLKK
jgi:hypothetical protein